jgi:hypothetical protein
MTTVTKPHDEKLDPSHARVLNQLSDGLSNAASVAIVVGLERKHFLRLARAAFDFMQNWNDHARKQQE